jgi:hypothetical protein
MATIISTTFRLKRGLAAKWQELNLVLDPGEPGFELDTYRLKIGDGQTAWNDLPYIGYNGTGGDGDIIVDTVLSDTSLNPIANKPVKVALDRLESLIEHYEFGDEFIITETNGIKTVSIDLEALASLLPQVDTDKFATKEEVRELVQTVSELAAALAQIKVPSKVSELENDAGYLTEHQDLSEYAKKTEIPSIEGLATEEYVNTVIGNIKPTEAELYKVDFNAPDYVKAVEAYNKGKVLVLINAAPDINSYAIMNYVSEKYITFTKFLTSRSETYGSFNTYYLSPANTWEISKEVKLNKVEAIADADNNINALVIGKNTYSFDNFATTEIVNTLSQNIENNYVSNEALEQKNYVTEQYVTNNYVTQEAVSGIVESEVDEVVSEKVEIVIQEKIEAGELNVSADAIKYDTWD